MDEQNPNSAEPEKPAPRLPRRYIKAAQPGHNFLAVGLIVLGAAGGGLFVLVHAGMRSTAGARASTRLKWDLREAELDRAIAKAQAEGKLRKPAAGTEVPDGGR